MKTNIEAHRNVQTSTKNTLGECQAMVDCESETIRRTKETMAQTQDANALLMREMGILENRKATLGASINTVNRQIDLQEV